uniref:Zinc transporter ZIP1-like n=1 Tax=Hirondellea gigas TaxID=1518452 RepID=A0A6A7G4E7_9CRUS
MLDIVNIKVLVLLFMFVITLVASLLPLAFVKRIRNTTDANRRSTYEMVLSSLSCFAGGVFMGTCILDLFPDTQEAIDKLLQHYPPSMRAFPVAEFIVVFGFLFVMTIEQIVLWHKEQALLCSTETARLLEEGPCTDQSRHESLRREYSLEGVTDRPDLTGSMRSTGSAVVNYRATANTSTDLSDGI